MVFRLLVVSCLLALSCERSLGQLFTGRVAEAGAGGLPGATVLELGTGRGAVTDGEGVFTIRLKRLPTRLELRCVGFRSDTVEVATAAPGQVFALSPEVVEAGEVQVTAARQGEGFAHLDAKIATQVASADGGVEGIIKSQMGVSSNSELSSQYRVRGGNFDENLVYVGGVEIYRPFLIRSGEQEGLSFVNPDLVDDLQFSAGGFDASYGDKLSSVLSVTYKRPQHFRAGLKLSLLGASAHIQGPSKKGLFTHITGVRYKTNQYLMGSLDTRGDYAPAFFDAQTFWNFGWRRVSLGILAYYAQNKYFFKPRDRETNFGTLTDTKRLTIFFEGKERDLYHTLVAAADVSFQATPDVRVALTGTLFRTSEEENYDILGEYWLQQALATQVEGLVDQSTGIGVGANMQHARNTLFGQLGSAAASVEANTGAVNLRAQLRYTREHYLDHTDEWEYTDSAGYFGPPQTGALDMDVRRRADNALNANKIDGYVQAASRTLHMGEAQCMVALGVRVAHASEPDNTVVSPRLNVSWRLRLWRFRLAAGRYCQLPSLRELKDDTGALANGLGPQKSWQVIAGVERTFGNEQRPYKFTAELYYKWLRDLNPYTIDNVRLRYQANNSARGYAWGLDLKLNGRLTGEAESWLTLSLMQTREDIDGDGHGYIPRPSDQRLQFSMMLQDHIPVHKSFTAMLNMLFGTGLPFGPAGCQRWQETSRMPGYKRVDLGVYKDFALNAAGEPKREHLRSAKLGVEVLNLFDFDNTISHFWVADSQRHRYGVPNYLTGRRINARFTLEF